MAKSNYIVYVGARGEAVPSNPVYTTWFVDINRDIGQDEELMAIVEAEAARANGDFVAEGELWAITSATVNETANLPANEGGNFTCAVAIGGFKPGVGKEKVLIVNSTSPSMAVAQVVDQVRSWSGVSVSENVTVPYMIATEADGA